MHTERLVKHITTIDKIEAREYLKKEKDMAKSESEVRQSRLGLSGIVIVIPSTKCSLTVTYPLNGHTDVCKINTLSYCETRK